MSRGWGHLIPVFAAIDFPSLGSERGFAHAPQPLALLWLGRTSGSQVPSAFRVALMQRGQHETLCRYWKAIPVAKRRAAKQRYLRRS